jgi:hypothetical protein
MEAAIFVQTSTEMEATTMAEPFSKTEATIWQGLFGGVLFLIASFFTFRHFWKKKQIRWN